GFPVPDPFIWDASFKTFYDDLDNQHKQLFQAILTQGNVGGATAGDNAYACLVAHFLFEEAAMQVAKYGGYGAHKAAHEEFLGKVKGGSADAAYCKDWLTQHIKTIDFKYKGKL
uniref:Hemerythrin n=1 Tax=Siphonosoma cumanense TaxID=6444 RepID=HEMT_SIPCU|nr:RecName: Full=Hemerythrin [Siphonosoma cumanense]